MKLKKLIFALVIFAGCSFTIFQDNDPLAHINHVNKLKLVYKNDKCGEWGGDRESIIIYRKDFKGNIYADYLKEFRNCESPYSEEIKKEEKSQIKIIEEDKELIIEAINQLSTGILARENYPSHSGNYSLVLLSDSSIVIEDFPSIRWTKFEKLRERLLIREALVND